MPLLIGGEERRATETFRDISPIDTDLLLGYFQKGGRQDALDAIAAAQSRQQKGGASTPWQERVAILRKAADLMDERTFEIAALMSLEVGKNSPGSAGRHRRNRRSHPLRLRRPGKTRRLQTPAAFRIAQASQLQRAQTLRRLGRDLALQLPGGAGRRAYRSRALSLATPSSSNRPPTRPTPPGNWPNASAMPACPTAPSTTSPGLAAPWARP